MIRPAVRPWSRWTIRARLVVVIALLAGLAVLDQQAGKKATVTGTVNGTTIDVSNVAAAK